MAEQFLTLMAELDDESQAKMSDLYEKLQEKGFTGVQTSGLSVLTRYIKFLHGVYVL